MFTFEVTTLLPSESKALRGSIKALIPNAVFDRFNSTCFNVEIPEGDSTYALEEFLGSESEKTATTKWRLV